MNEERLLIRNLHHYFAEKRGLEATYCPSEVARAYHSELWREHMELVRQVADEMVRENLVVTLQKNAISSILPSKIKGPIRLRKK